MVSEEAPQLQEQGAPTKQNSLEESDFHHVRMGLIGSDFPPGGALSPPVISSSVGTSTVSGQRPSARAQEVE